MATNQNGHLVDSAGNVAVDFVWGNFPLQPNDVRRDNGGTNLDYTLDSHNIAESAYNGYPQYTPNDDGAFTGGVAYVVVPNVLGQLTADAVDTLTDSEFTITTAAGATNTATQPTQINVTSTTAATVTVSGGTSTWAVGTKVTIATGTGIPAALVGTWTVTGGSASTLVIAGSGWTVANTGAITPGTRLTGAAGTIKTQSIAANAGNISAGAAITITPWA
jgi:hypothetical protein